MSLDMIYKYRYVARGRNGGFVYSNYINYIRSILL